MDGIVEVSVELGIVGVASAGIAGSGMLVAAGAISDCTSLLVAASDITAGAAGMAGSDGMATGAAASAVLTFGAGMSVFIGMPLSVGIAVALSAGVVVLSCDLLPSFIKSNNPIWSYSFLMRFIVMPPSYSLRFEMHNRGH
jgi:hypothetical protein